MALVVAEKPNVAEHSRKLLFVPNGDHVTDIDAAGSRSSRSLVSL